MPRRLQVEFSGVVQQFTDAHGSEMTAEDIWQLFNRTYTEPASPLRLHDYQLQSQADGQAIRMTVDVNGIPTILNGAGNGPVDAAIHALQGIGVYAQVRSFEERSIGASASAGDAAACAFVEVVCGDKVCYGVGIHPNIVTASIQAIFSGINRTGDLVSETLTKTA
jgi:2-isopropylmalate synthase